MERPRVRWGGSSGSIYTMLILGVGAGVSEVSLLCPGLFGRTPKGVSILGGLFQQVTVPNIDTSASKDPC